MARVAALGFGLLHDAGYNGAEPSVMAPKPVPKPQSAPKVKQRRQSRKSVPFTIDQITAYIAGHPGCSTSEIGRALIPAGYDGRTNPLQLVNNRVNGYRARHGVLPFEGRSVMENGRRLTRYYPNA